MEIMDVSSGLCVGIKLLETIFSVAKLHCGVCIVFL